MDGINREGKIGEEDGCQLWLLPFNLESGHYVT